MSVALRLALLLACCAAPASAAQPAERGAPPPVSRAAQQVFEGARDRLLQIRVLVQASRTQRSLGSGFVVGAGGLVLTNWHVVSEFALNPDAFVIELRTTDGRTAGLELLSFDVVHDLALLRIAPGAQRRIAPLALARREPVRGERVYSLGNPHDLGFVIIEGTYNGPVERQLHERLHFSGALNPGMSGGPALDGAGRVIGINVAKRLGAEQVSFLVPARYARALLDGAAQRSGAAPLATAPQVRARIAEQLRANQTDLLAAFARGGARTETLGPFRVPAGDPQLLRCWADTNENQPRRRYRRDTTRCELEADVYVDERLQTSTLRFSHSYLANLSLDALRFAALYAREYSLREARPGAVRDELTAAQCREDFVERAGLTLRVSLCAQAYRRFPGLYNMRLAVATLGAGAEGVQSSAQLAGVSFDGGLAFMRGFVEAFGRER